MNFVFKKSVYKYKATYNGKGINISNTYVRGIISLIENISNS